MPKQVKRADGPKRIGSPLGSGVKIDLYVPGVDQWVVDEVERRVAVQKAGGFRTSFSFELLRVVKIGLQHLTQERQQIEPLKS